MLRKEYTEQFLFYSQQSITSLGKEWRLRRWLLSAVSQLGGTKWNHPTAPAKSKRRYFFPTVRSSNADSLLWNVWGQNINVVFRRNWINWWGNDLLKAKWIHRAECVPMWRDWKAGAAFSGRRWVIRQQWSRWKNWSRQRKQIRHLYLLPLESQGVVASPAPAALWTWGDCACIGQK